MTAETGDRLAFPIEGANAADQDASALDILAQASQLDVAQGDTPTPETAVDLDPSKPTAASHPSSVGKASSSSTLEPAIDLHPSSTPRTEPRVLDPTPTQAQPLATPQARPRNLSNASELQTPAQRLLYPPESPGPFDDPHQHGLYPPATDPPPGAFASPTGATVPGLGKYVHLSSSMPARRVRSPYLKWTVEEVSHPTERSPESDPVLIGPGRAPSSGSSYARREVGSGIERCTHAILSSGPPTVSILFIRTFVNAHKG